MSDTTIQLGRSSGKVRPYPWSTLDALTRDDASAGRALRVAGRTLAATEKLAESLSALAGARVEVLVRRVRSSATPARGEEGIGVLVGTSDSPEASMAALVEVEPALGAALVARALRRGTPRAIAAGKTGDVLAGSVAAIVLAVARRMHAVRALRVLAAGPARALERDLASAGGDLVEASLTVLVDDDAFAARLLVPRAALAAPSLPWTREALAALGDVPLSLAIVAAVNRSTAAEIGSLRRGDAWIPGAWALRLSSSGVLAGPVLLASPACEVGVSAALGDDGRLVVREGVESLAWAQEGSGVSEMEKDALVDAVGEVPVVVRVELGVVEMRAREWASLGRGDIVALGRKIGEAVTLRVGGVTVARGDLVDLDGEVAVRILGRTDDTKDER